MRHTSVHGEQYPSTLVFTSSASSTVASWSLKFKVTQMSASGF